MDRHRHVHKRARVELPGSVTSLDNALHPERSTPIRPHLSPHPMLSELAATLGRVGVFTCGLAVIVTASLLAMHVH